MFSFYLIWHFFNIQMGTYETMNRIGFSKYINNTEKKRVFTVTHVHVRDYQTHSIELNGDIS